jgi:type IV pilus assembly protein PilV
MANKHEHLRLHKVAPNRRTNRGIALIEALVGILIFTTGILGVVGLQASMTKAQGSAKTRSEASMLANELIGLMWSDYSNTSTVKITNYESPANSACSAQPCATWIAKVQSTLPSGNAVVSTNSANGAVSITISWTTPAEGSHSYVTQTTIQ